MKWARWQPVAMLAAMLGLALGLSAAPGCASPMEEENYKENERDREMLETEEKDPMFDSRMPRDGEMRIVRYAHLAQNETGQTATGENASSASSASNASNDRNISEPPATQPYQPTTLLGNDRENWRPVTFRAASGQTTHPPIYIHTPLPEYDSDKLTTGPVEDRLRFAGADTEDRLWSMHNLAHVPCESLRFGAQTAFLPVKLFLVPPWTEQTSP